MSFGSISGRAFESPLAPYLFGAIAVIALVLWVAFHIHLRKIRRDDDRDDGPPDGA